jgi:filamentous hemagglutinin family protein
MISGRRNLLFATASLTALLGSGAPHSAIAASAASLLSPAGLAQAAGQSGANSQGASGQAAGLTNPAIQAQIALSAANLAKAAQEIKALTAAQTSASAASQLTLNNAPLSGSAWNGTTLSGLNPVNDQDPTLWVNAGTLQKNTATATATVTQTASKALLTWQSFDLNKGETLVFNQQGNADWTVLNRIVAGPAHADGSRFVASPSYILGSIKADGTVYVINPNGIIFGGSAQVNVHSLIASSLDVGDPTMTVAERNSFYLNQGITTATGFNPSFSYNQSDTVLEGSVVVEAGASITASLAPRSVSPDAGGFVYLFAPNVENDGTISTPAGETLMVAAQQLQLTPNIYAEAGVGSPGNPVSTFRAVGVNIKLDPQDESALAPWRTGVANGADEIKAPGTVINTGLIDAERGVVILNGDEVTNGALYNAAGVATQSGVIEASTSITRNSEIYIDARLQLTLSGGSSIQILPDENGETIPLSAILDSTAAAPSFVAGSIEVSGNTVNMESGSLIEAPGGAVSVNGTPFAGVVAFEEFPTASAQAIEAAQARQLARIYLAPDSAIDVSGLDDVTIPISDELLSFKPFGNEFADQPLQRNGALRGVELTVDIRQTGTYNGVAWIGTPLADVSSLANNVTRSIDQLLTTGGTVKLNSPQPDEIILRQGSTINVAGGYVRYLGGFVDTTNLLTADGRIVNIANASPLDTYVGVAGVSTLTHPHWGATTTETYINPTLAGGYYQASYVEGHDAGGITLNNSGNISPNYALDGSFYAGVVIGEQQAASGIRNTAGTANSVYAPSGDMPTAGFFSIYGENDLAIVEQVKPLDSKFKIADALPSADAATTELSASALSSADFGSISATFTGALTVESNAALSVANGGSITLTVGNATINGALSARSGSISVTTTSSLANAVTPVLTSPAPPDLFNLTIGSTGLLDVSGEWINDTGATAEKLVGGAYVNGGKISLKTDANTVSCGTDACNSLFGGNGSANVDLTANIVLSSGSRLDVSSGGRIGVNGQFQTDSEGRAVGAGGSVTLATYATSFQAGSGGEVATTQIPSATIILGGSDGTANGNAAAIAKTIDAFGFSQGGAFSLQAPTIQIGGAQSTRPGALTLPASFFADSGFGSYSLSSVVGGLTVVRNTTVVLEQQNLIAGKDLIGLATGSKVENATGIGLLPAYIRSPVNLTLSATLDPLPFYPYTSSSTTSPPALNPAVALLIEAGAVIEGDAAAGGTPSAITILANGRDPQTVGNAESGVNQIGQQIGVAEILGGIRDPGGSITVTGGDVGEVWLGSTAKLDASGAVVIDALQTIYRAGTVLGGGSVAISAGSSGAIVGLTGATIDVSGAAGVLDIASTSGANGLPGIQYLPTRVWSDAGSISLTAPTVVYDGGFVAKGGAALANGGSLTVQALQNNAPTLTVVQGGDVVPAALKPTDSLGAATGDVFFQADELSGSGIENLTLTSGATALTGTIAFSGNVQIGGLATLTLNASTITSSRTAAPTNGCNICLSATYVDLQSTGTAASAAAAGILQIKADMIDIAADASQSGYLYLDVATADLISAGDIRLGVPVTSGSVNGQGDAPALAVGQMVAAGDLTFTAQQVYPETNVDFTLKSTADNGVITFNGNGKAAALPLSAGGQVTVDAAVIDQDGTLRAPLGVIRLGAQTAADLSPNDTTGLFIKTRTVTLASGSITSVSLDGEIVPYGETADGKNWTYDNVNAIPLAGAPAKSIDIAADNVNMATGATVDLRGGGDIQAIEFVSGTGGTRDVLTNLNPAAPNTYAIIPGYNPVAAPVDFDFLSVKGDALSAAGSSIYLTASSGLPAGYYTLLPAHYATLPGAYRVQIVQGTQDVLASQNRVLADGTAQVAGYLGNGDAGTRAARSVLVDVQSSAVWRQYSQITQTSGNTYFASLAASATSVDAASRLPIDAGHLVIDASVTANLQSQILSAAAAGGRGAEVDIAGTDLEVLSGAGKAADGYLGLSATQLSGLNVDSLLIGGVRTDGADNEETINVTADSIEIANDANAPLVGKQIILATAVSKSQSDPNAANGLILKGGSVIEASGTLAANDPTNLILSSTHGFVTGEGALFAVSAGGPLTATRTGATYLAGNLTIDSGAKIAGNSLTLDATGATRIASGVAFPIAQISIASPSFTFGGHAAGTTGIVLSEAVLTELTAGKSLALQSLDGPMTFDGAVNIAMGSGSALSLDSGVLAAGAGAKVSISAGSVTFINTGAAPTGTAAAGTGALTVDAQTITLSSGAKQWSGFGAATLNGSTQIALASSTSTVSGSAVTTTTGSLDAGAANLAFATPRFLVGGGVTQTITTTGTAAFSSASGPGTVTSEAEIGGSLTLDAASISSDTLIQATAGAVTLEATSGNVTLSTGSEILATGFARAFFDVTRVTSGGSVSIIADKGDIDAAAGSTIDVSSAQGWVGNAGAVTLSAANGVLSSGGGAFDVATIAGSVAGDSGGSLSIDAQSIGAQSIAAPALFSNTVDIEIRRGDFGVTSALTAQTVNVTVDTGTLTVSQTIDASGAAGGAISLFGGQGVVLTSSAKLLATASNAARKGGDIVIGTEVASDNGSGSDGVIDLEGGLIDVSNTANAANGGTVRLRAPLTASGDDVAIDTVAATIKGASSVTVEAFKVFDSSNGFNGVIDPANNQAFYGDCNSVGVCTGTLPSFVENFALSASSQQKFASISSSVLNLQPGIELVSSGDITVASAWNLGSGIAGNLVNAVAFTAADGNTVAAGSRVVTDQYGNLLPQYATLYAGQPLAFINGVSQITSLFYRVGSNPLGAAGALTIRAGGTLNVGASITDGFFQTENRQDPTYVQSTIAWYQQAFGANTNLTDVNGYLIAGATYANPVDGSGNSLDLGPAPIAPYVAAANGVSPGKIKNDEAPIAGADLFPLIQNANGSYSAIGSWSYRLVGGADTTSANPLALQPLVNFTATGSAQAGKGDVVISGGGRVRDTNVNSDGNPTIFEIPTIVRTGTGSIDIAAGLDFILANTEAPGVVYTGGRNSVELANPGYKMKTVSDPLNPGQTIRIAVATDPSGFLEPDVIACDPGATFSCNAYGPLTAAAYPIDGGNLTVTAQRDIIGQQNLSVPDLIDGGKQPNDQFFAPWLLSQGTSMSNTQYGVFSPLSGYYNASGNQFTPSQTSWWINFGSFDQGLMSVGGNVKVVAGRDIDQLGVSLPTTARVSGGLSATITNASGQTVANIPVVNLNPSGDLTVIAGRDINSGVFYEGSGQATISAGGSVQANWSARALPSQSTSPLIPVSTLLAVDTGSITLTARGVVNLAGVVSGASMQNTTDISQTIAVEYESTFLSSYGPNSEVTVESVAGDIAVNSLTDASILIHNHETLTSSATQISGYMGVSLYPANFEAIAISGSVNILGPLKLAPSNTGVLDLLAYNSLSTQATLNPDTVADQFDALSTGVSLIEQNFNANEPLAGFAPPVGSQVLDLGAELLHVGDTTPDLFYAVTGDIVSGRGLSSDTSIQPLSWEITKVSQVHAGQDIIDLPFFGQNLAKTDVTQIIAGRDIFYTGDLAIEPPLSGTDVRPALPEYENSAGLSLAGPGFFDIEAGRNLGPFVTATADELATKQQGVSDSTGTGIITFGNTVTVGNRISVDGLGFQNSNAIDDPFASTANFLLPREGADIVTMFGVGKGADYAAVIGAYVNPATATSAANYGGALIDFVEELGLSASTTTEAWAVFQKLPTKLQDVFADQVYFSELKLAGNNGDSARGYAIVNTLFPTSLGYTDNGPNGKGPAKQVATGNLEMLHATIKTLQSATITVTGANGAKSTVAVGGDIYLLGPGGNIDVGSQAVEINKFFTDSALGILTLDNGVIDSFTDGDLLVNQSRVLTVQGGDIILWSSNGNLDAGKGAKTTVDYKPLSVNFDPNDLQTINLNGLVSGAGIGTIQSTPDAPVASATLIAPRGTVNAGDAGLRSSGDLAIVALRVLNAANISVAGAVSGVPQVNSVNLGALESANSTAGGAAQAAEDSIASAGRAAQAAPRALPSLITVEVLGFGDCDPEAGQKCPE